MVKGPPVINLLQRKRMPHSDDGAIADEEGERDEEEKEKRRGEERRGEGEFSFAQIGGENE